MILFHKMEDGTVIKLPWKQNPRTDKGCHKPSAICHVGRTNCTDCPKVKGSKALKKAKGYIPKFKKIEEETD